MKKDTNIIGVIKNLSKLSLALLCLCAYSANASSENVDNGVRDKAINYIDVNLSVDISNNYKGLEVGENKVIFKSLEFDKDVDFAIFDKISLKIDDLIYEEDEISENLYFENAEIKISNNTDVGFIKDNYEVSFRKKTSKEVYHNLFYDISISGLMDYKIDLRTKRLKTFNDSVTYVEFLNIKFSTYFGVGDLIKTGEFDQLDSFIRFMLGDDIYFDAVSNNKMIDIEVSNNTEIPLSDFNVAIYTLDMMLGNDNFGVQIMEDYSIKEIMEELDFNYSIKVK